MQYRGLTLGALLCVLAHFASADGGEDPKKERGGFKGFGKAMRRHGGQFEGSEDPKFCGGRLMGPPGTCCKIPMLFPKETFAECAPWISKMGRSGRGKKSGKAAKSATPEQAAAPGPVQAAGANGDGKKGGMFGGMFGGQMMKMMRSSQGGGGCVVDCLFTKKNLFTGDIIDKEKTKAYFLEQSKSDAAFVPLVEEACNTCHDDYMKSNLTATSRQFSGTECKNSHAQYLTCVRRKLETACPSSAETVNADCTERKSKLLACDPFYTPDKEEFRKKIATLRAERRNKKKGSGDSSAPPPAGR